MLVGKSVRDISEQQERDHWEAENQDGPPQQKFISTVESFIRPYREAPNQLQASAVRVKRQEALRSLMPYMRVKGWTGTLESMATNSKGHASITVQPSGTTSITLVSAVDIPHGSALFDTIANLKTGDPIAFGGWFVPENQDYIEEISFTERGAMTDPEFKFRFTEIAKQ